MFSTLLLNKKGPRKRKQLSIVYYKFIPFVFFQSQYLSFLLVHIAAAGPGPSSASGHRAMTTPSSLFILS